MTRVLVYLSLDSLEAVEGTCDQRRLWSDCADAQADLSLLWSQKSKWRFFCCALAQMFEVCKVFNICLLWLWREKKDSKANIKSCDNLCVRMSVIRHDIYVRYRNVVFCQGCCKVLKKIHTRLAIILFLACWNSSRRPLTALNLRTP